jgi:hypothetical protein
MRVSIESKRAKEVDEDGKMQRENWRIWIFRDRKVDGGPGFVRLIGHSVLCRKYKKAPPFRRGKSRLPANRNN